MESGITTMATVSPSQKRLQKELMSLIREPPPGVRVDGDLAGKNLTQWIVHLEGAKGTLFEGERFQLQFKFSSKYPFESPEVTFIGGNIPVHPHVYSNGHICLSILTDDWSPALSVQSVCLSIVSMLSSCTEKKRPMDNAFYVRTCNKNPKKTKWWYHGTSWTYGKMTVCNSSCQSSLMIYQCADIAGPSGMTFCVSWMYCPNFIDKIAGETSPYY